MDKHRTLAAPAAILCAGAIYLTLLIVVGAW